MSDRNTATGGLPVTIPAVVNVTDDATYGYSCYRKQIFVPATPNVIVGPGGTSMIKYPTSTTPGAFIVPYYHFYEGKLTITNPNPYIDYLDLDIMGWHGLVQKAVLEVNGKAIETIDNYDRVMKRHMEVYGMIPPVKFLYRPNDYLLYDTTERTMGNCLGKVKPPMVDCAGKVMPSSVKYLRRVIPFIGTDEIAKVSCGFSTDPYSGLVGVIPTIPPYQYGGTFAPYAIPGEGANDDTAFPATIGDLKYGTKPIPAFSTGTIWTSGDGVIPPFSDGETDVGQTLPQVLPYTQYTNMQLCATAGRQFSPAIAISYPLVTPGNPSNTDPYTKFTNPCKRQLGMFGPMNRVVSEFYAPYNIYTLPDTWKTYYPPPDDKEIYISDEDAIHQGKNLKRIPVGVVSIIAPSVMFDFEHTNYTHPAFTGQSLPLGTSFGATYTSPGENGHGPATKGSALGSDSSAMTISYYASCTSKAMIGLTGTPKSGTPMTFTTGQTNTGSVYPTYRQTSNPSGDSGTYINGTYETNFQITPFFGLFSTGNYFPMFLIDALRVYFTWQQPQLVFKVGMDPCRVVKGTWRDFVPFAGNQWYFPKVSGNVDVAPASASVGAGKPACIPTQFGYVTSALLIDTAGLWPTFNGGYTTDNHNPAGEGGASNQSYYYLTGKFPQWFSAFYAAAPPENYSDARDPPFPQEVPFTPGGNWGTSIGLGNVSGTIARSQMLPTVYPNRQYPSTWSKYSDQASFSYAYPTNCASRIPRQPQNGAMVSPYQPWAFNLEKISNPKFVSETSVYPRSGTSGVQLTTLSGDTSYQSGNNGLAVMGDPTSSSTGNTEFWDSPESFSNGLDGRQYGMCVKSHMFPEYWHPTYTADDSTLPVNCTAITQFTCPQNPLHGCYGSEFDCSIPQVRRCFYNQNNTPQAGTAGQFVNQMNLPTYTIADFRLNIVILSLPDNATRDLVGAAIDGAISIWGKTYKTVDAIPLTAASVNNITVPINQSSVQWMDFTFYTADMRGLSSPQDAFMFNSCASPCPFTSYGWKDDGVSSMGSNIAPTISQPGPKDNPFSVQLQLSTNYYPFTPMTSIMDMLTNNKQVSARGDQIIRQKTGITYSQTETNSLGGSKAVYDIIRPGFLTAYINWRALSDQTIFNNPQCNLFYSMNNDAVSNVTQLNGAQGKAVKPGAWDPILVDGTNNPDFINITNSGFQHCNIGAYRLPLYEIPDGSFHLSFDLNMWPVRETGDSIICGAFTSGIPINLNMNGTVGCSGSPNVQWFAFVIARCDIHYLIVGGGGMDAFV